jgi:hypothetical protein
MTALIAGVLVLWLVVVFLLGAVGAFERPPGTPPVPILIGAVGPLVVFLAAYWGSARFRGCLPGRPDWATPRSASRTRSISTAGTCNIREGCWR